jgi:hypothetical protein
MARPSDPPPDGARRSEAPDELEPTGLERWIAPYFRDSTLWPVLAVAAAVGVTGLAGVLLLAAVDRNPFAAAAGLALAWMSVDASLRERRARHRLGLAGRSLLALWALGIAAALAAWRGGLF